MNLFSGIISKAKTIFSGAAIVCLLLSAILWYMSKLSYTYTARVPVAVNVEGQRIKVGCIVEATGFRIFAHRYLINNTVNVKLEQVHATPSLTTPGSYSLDPFSLQNLISFKNGDLKILSVESVPEVAVKSND